jgi:hypothetical protein
MRGILLIQSISSSIQAQSLSCMHPALHPPTHQSIPLSPSLRLRPTVIQLPETCSLRNKPQSPPARTPIALIRLFPARTPIALVGCFEGISDDGMARPLQVLLHVFEP